VTVTIFSLYGISNYVIARNPEGMTKQSGRVLEVLTGLLRHPFGIPRNNILKFWFRQLLVLSLLPVFSSATAQTLASYSDERPGVILIRISPQIVPALRQQFQTVRPASDPEFRHTDIHTAVLSGDSTIGITLGITGLHGLELRPYIPTHSIVFEDIRERSNPQLFSKGLTIGSTGKTSNELSAAEEKLSRWFILSYSDPLTPEAAKFIARKSSLIELAEPKYIRHSLYTPNDPFVPQQYALPLIHAFEAWDVVRCDSNTLVADVDIGTDWTHEDLISAVYNNPGEIGIDSNGIDKRANGVDDDGNGLIDDWHGWDFDGPAGDTPDNNPTTSASHGTHTAGIMAAAGNNNTGIAGVAFGARLLPIKVSSDRDPNNLDFGFEGVTYAADMHAKAVNCSWGGPTRSDAEQDVVNYAYAKDCAVVAAAGNNGINQYFYPAAYDHVMGVGASQSSGQLDSYSNFNTRVSVYAPGTDVLSTVPGNQYETLTGTSMASPNACGCVALVRQRFPWMTAGQAMQQVRATAQPMPVSPDRQDLVGHGLVDAYLAVTDTNARSARIESSTVSNENGSGPLTSGENGSIVLGVRNFLGPVNNLMATMEVVQGSDMITLHDTLVSFGPAQMMQVVQNQASALQVTVNDAVPPNTMVLVKVTFFDSTVGYTADVDYFSFIINPSYLDLNKNNITATFSSKGSIGYQDIITNTEGSGFKWRNPPPSILPLSVSVLYQGGIMIGNDSEHVVDVVANADYSEDDDLQPTGIIQNITLPDHANAIQELACQYSDSLADPAIQIGVKVDQQAYAFDSGLAANAVVVRYVLRKIPPNSDWQPSDSTAAVLYMDWDVGLSGAINVTHYDTLTGEAITYRLDPGYPYVGMKVISPLPPGAAIQYHAIYNNGAQGDINNYDGFSKEEKWLAMSEFYGATGPGDVSHTYGLKNLPMRSQDSVTIVMVIALAENADMLTQTIDATTRAWNGTAGVTDAQIPHGNSIETFPNPFRNAVTITWQTAANDALPAHITIYDALGRGVCSANVLGTSYDFSSANLAEGFYTVDIVTGGKHLTKRVVSIR
jgi:serine protease